MGNDDIADDVVTLPPRATKVHKAMFKELMKLVDGVEKIFPEIEAARPRCSSGIEALCLLNGAIEKARLLFQYCSDSSKLYLVITGEAVLSRCKKSRNLLERSLSQIQSMVPIMLAAEISKILLDIRSAKFSLDPSEEEAGKIVKNLLTQYNFVTNSMEESAIDGLRSALLRLNISSRKGLLIERRSIKKLLNTVGDGDQTKKQILAFLLNLLNKYGKLIVGGESDDALVTSECSVSTSTTGSYTQPIQIDGNRENERQDSRAEILRRPIPPEEFKCPMSLKIMYDPVIIESGQTFERLWIQKWFDEGHNTCPKTKMKLSNSTLTVNSVLKNLISGWCMVHGITIPDPSGPFVGTHSWEASSSSVASLSSSLYDLHLPVDYSHVSVSSLDNSRNSVSTNNRVTHGLHSVEIKTDDDSQRFYPGFSPPKTNVVSLRELDALPWESQCEAVEDLMTNLKRDDRTCSDGDFVGPLVQFLKYACDLDDVKSQRKGCQLFLEFLNKSRTEPCLDKDAYDMFASFLDSELAKEALAVMEVLTLKSNIHSFIESSKFIPKLIPFFEDPSLARHCVGILKNLCSAKEEFRASVAETTGCVSCIAKLLESKSCADQEKAADVLLLLCSQSASFCQAVMAEGIIPSLVSISAYGSDRGMAYAVELRRLLRDAEYDTVQEAPVPDSNSSNRTNEKKPSSRAPRIFAKLSIFSRNSRASKRKV